MGLFKDQLTHEPINLNAHTYSSSTCTVGTSPQLVEWLLSNTHDCNRYRWIHHFVRPCNNMLRSRNIYHTTCTSANIYAYGSGSCLILIKGSVLVSGVVLYTSLCSWDSVLIKGGVLISRVVLYTSLCSWDSGQCTD